MPFDHSSCDSELIALESRLSSRPGVGGRRSNLYQAHPQALEAAVVVSTEEVHSTAQTGIETPSEAKRTLV